MLRLQSADAGEVQVFRDRAPILVASCCTGERMHHRCLPVVDPALGG